MSVVEPRHKRVLRLQIEDLRSALDLDQIVPYFQPIIDLKLAQITGFEVLARRVHPGSEASLPLGMIRLAEESDLIGRVTEAMIWKAAELARTLPSHLRYSINISPSQYCHVDFAENLLALLQRVGLSASQVVIEITESTLFDNFDLAIAISRQLKSYGIKLALDDFGTGYSSLRHLQVLPFDELKIDGSFVNAMSERRETRKIVAAIVGLGHSLGLTTVAEGIETKEHAEMLLYLGCGRGQGWLFSRPLPASQVASLFADGQTIGASLPSSAASAADTIASTLEVLPAQRLFQLQAIYDGAPVSLCFLDRNLRYISLNKRFTEAHGKPLGTYLGRTVAEVLPEFFPEVQPHLLKALRGDSVSDIEVSRPDPDHPDRMKTFLVSYHPAKDEVGEVVGISCVAVDITERKRTELALRASIDHYWRAAGTNPQIPWTAGPDGDMIDVSPRWEILTGIPYEDILEGRGIDYIHEDDREQVLHWYRTAISNGTPLDMLYRVIRKDGEMIWVRTSAAARCGADGKIIRWYGTFEVIDAMKIPESGLAL